MTNGPEKIVFCGIEAGAYASEAQQSELFHSQDSSCL
jgi:hypothetical protein